MAGGTTELQAIDKGPGEAIMAGFSLVAADNESLGATLRAAAKKASDEFTASVENFPKGTRERQYLEELLMAAVSFAAGLSRRQQERMHRVRAAEQERSFQMRRIIQTQRLGGVLRGGVQLLLVGGVAYALARVVFSARTIEPDPDHAKYVSLATAMASALLGAFGKAWWLGWKLDQIDKRYKAALQEAKDIYSGEAHQEYEFAAQEAQLAWRKFTGRAAPMTDAFRVLVLSLLGAEDPGDLREAAAKREKSGAVV